MTLRPSSRVRKIKLHCKYCRTSPTVEIPDEIDLSSPLGDEFVGNIRCTICKNVGYLVVRSVFEDGRLC